jgi:hypothetical protein
MKAIMLTIADEKAAGVKSFFIHLFAKHTGEVVIIMVASESGCVG